MTHRIFVTCFIGVAARSLKGRRRPGRQITLEQDGGGNAIDRAFAFFPAHIGGDQQIFRRFRRHPLVPEHERHGQPGLQLRRKLAHGADRRALAAVQLERQPQHHPLYIVRADQRRNVRHVPVQCPPLESLQRLCRPAQFVAQGDPDPFGAVVEGEDAARHDSTAGGTVRPSQRLFPARYRARRDLCRRPGPSPAGRRRCRPHRRPSF